MKEEKKISVVKDDFNYLFKNELEKVRQENENLADEVMEVVEDVRVVIEVSRTGGGEENFSLFLNQQTPNSTDSKKFYGFEIPKSFFDAEDVKSVAEGIKREENMTAPSDCYFDIDDVFEVIETLENEITKFFEEMTDFESIEAKEKFIGEIKNLIS